MHGPDDPTPTRTPAAAARPIVLVHGWGGTFESTWAAGGWVEACRALGRPVIPVGLAGHGRGRGGGSGSGGSDGDDAVGGGGGGLPSHDPEDYADLASDLAADLARALPGDDRAVDAVGFSLGAKVLLELACRGGDRGGDQCGGRFRRLVLGGLGANVFAPEALGADLATVLEEGCAADTPAVLRDLAESAIRAGNDPRAVAAVLRRKPNPVATADRLAAVNCRVLLIAGDQDTVAQPISPLAAALRTARSEDLPGVGHLGLPADPRFQRSALAFLTDTGDE